MFVLAVYFFDLSLAVFEGATLRLNISVRNKEGEQGEAVPFLLEVGMHFFKSGKHGMMKTCTKE